MGPKGKYGQASQSIFMSSMIGVANILAVVAAFIGSPWLHSKTIGWVQSYIANHYGYGFEDITAFVWFVICAGFVFFTSRASISTAIVMTALTIMTKFF